MEKQLIVNADGFGFGPGATQGVMDAIAGGGPVTSVSVNANFPEAERVSELVAQYPEISIGVHVNPIVGAPCLAPGRVPTLVGPDGLFHGRRFQSLWRSGKVAPAELEAEFDAQVGRIKEWVGNRLTHLDSHQNSHVRYFRLFLRLALRWRVPCIRNNASLIGLESENPRRARAITYLKRPHVWLAHAYRKVQMRRARRTGLRMVDRLITIGYAGEGDKADLETWLRLFRNLPEGIYEVYCHPAYPDDILRRWATYCEPRRQELEILRNPKLRDLAAVEGIRLISFTDLMEDHQSTSGFPACRAGLSG